MLEDAGHVELRVRHGVGVRLETCPPISSGGGVLPPRTCPFSSGNGPGGLQRLGLLSGKHTGYNFHCQEELSQTYIYGYLHDWSLELMEGEE